MLHGSIAAHHQERKASRSSAGPSFQTAAPPVCGFGFSNRPATPASCSLSAQTLQLVLIELTPDPPRRQTIGEAEDRLFGG